MYVHTCVQYSTFGGQGRASEFLGLELEPVMSHHVDAGNLPEQPALVVTEPPLQPHIILRFYFIVCIMCTRVSLCGRVYVSTGALGGQRSWSHRQL